MHQQLCFFRQLRQQPPEAVHVNGSQQQQPRLTASALARMQQLQSSSNIPESSATTRSLYDVKAMQKEAVLSYVKVINDASHALVIGLFSPEL